MDYLKTIGKGNIASETPDTSVQAVTNSNLSLISSIDFFYPLVEDPYMQGRIACCNVLSDLYAQGVEKIDTVLMVLGISLKMNEKQKEVVTALMIQGFDDCAKQAKTLVLGGQTVYNPWPMIGGVGISVSRPEEFIMPNNAKPGQILVMTKVLGTQLAVNAMQWLKTMPNLYQKIENIITPEQINEAFLLSEQSMATLNLSAAILLKKYNASASTDITGFGPFGHANLLASCQKEKVNFHIKRLPIIKNMTKIDKIVYDFQLIEGKSAETSGGLLLAFDKENGERFVEELTKNYGIFAHVVGEVTEGQNQAIMSENIEIIEI